MTPSMMVSELVANDKAIGKLRAQIASLQARQDALADGLINNVGAREAGQLVLAAQFPS